MPGTDREGLTGETALVGKCSESGRGCRKGTTEQTGGF